MGKSLLKSKKGVGTAVGAAFFIIIAVMAIATMWAVSSFETRYQNVRQKMTEWDIERISEDLSVRYVRIPSGRINYTYDLRVDSGGGITVNVARIYVYNQIDRALDVYNPQNGTANGFINGTINTGEANHTISVKGTALTDSKLYRIVLATDRGRQFSYIYPPYYSGGGGGGVYELVMVSDHYNFQYNASHKGYSYTPPATYKSAYIKRQSSDDDRPIYRILLNNTTTKKIHFHCNSTMLQLSSSGGENIVKRYVVSNLTSNADKNSKPTKFVDQIINPHAWQYLYFAGSTNGTITDPDWVSDPAPGGGAAAKYYLTGFLLIFTFEGETITRSISIPVVIQEIISK